MVYSCFRPGEAFRLLLVYWCLDAAVRDNGTTVGSPSLEPEKLLRMKVYDQTTDPFAEPQVRAQAAKQIAALAVALGEPQVRWALAKQIVPPSQLCLGASSGSYWVPMLRGDCAWLIWAEV